MPISPTGQLIDWEGNLQGSSVDLNTGAFSGAQNIPAAQTTTPNTNISTPAVPSIPDSANNLGYTSPDAQESAALKQYQQTQQQTQIAPTQQKPLPNTVSVVDLLNAAGQDSSFAARTNLAKQYGIQGYTGTANQNLELGKKFRELYEAKKTTQVPESGAEARTAIQTGLLPEPTEVIDPTKQFFDIYGGMNPVESQIYQQLSTMLSSVTTKQSFKDIYAEEAAKQGLPPLQEELANTISDIQLSEDQVRDEISRGGGMALDSQVRAIAAARSKTLLVKAQALSSIIDAKNDYIDNIVTLTKADRDQVSKDIDQKLGIADMVLNMTNRMQDRARENMGMLIKDVGYDGLMDSISTPQELNAAARALGISPQMLMQLSTMQTSDQQREELNELNYELSVAKFEEDKRQFGLQYALEQQKLSEKVAANTVVSPYQVERSTRNLQSISELLPKVSASTVGAGSLLGYVPGTPARNFAAEVDTLKANIIAGELTAMREASKTGGALGNVSDKESAFLSASLGALDLGQSPENFRKQLRKVEESIYRWNAQALSIGMGYNYKSAKDAGYSDKEIYNYLNK